jgi:hypothetical protein
LNDKNDTWQVFWLKRSLHLPILLNSGVREVAFLFFLPKAAIEERSLLQLRG